MIPRINNLPYAMMSCLKCLVVNVSAHSAWWSTSRIILWNNSFKLRIWKQTNGQNRVKPFFLFLGQSSHVRILTSVYALWMRIYHSPLVLVTYKYCAVSHCSCCEMLWPKLYKNNNHFTQVDKVREILFWEELTMFLSVCTVYFLNIRDVEISSVGSHHSVFCPCTVLARCCMSEMWKWQSNFFTIYVYLYV